MPPRIAVISLRKDATSAWSAFWVSACLAIIAINEFCIADTICSMPAEVAAMVICVHVRIRRAVVRFGLLCVLFLTQRSVTVAKEVVVDRFIRSD